MASFNVPDSFPIADQDGKATSVWVAWFSWAQSILSAAQSSGTTAQRPTSGLWLGRRYFDISLGPVVVSTGLPSGLPIYVSSVRPVVWVDSAGTVV